MNGLVIHQTRWGEPCDEEVVIEDYEDYEDGQSYFDHESDEEKTITSPLEASEKNLSVIIWVMHLTHLTDK